MILKWSEIFYASVLSTYLHITGCV